MALNRTIVAVLSFTLASAAQNQPPQNQPGQAGGTDSVLKTTTRLVIVDVVATNGKSEPVSDLRLQDFKVLENGKQQEVKVFDFQHPGQATASSALPHSSFSLPAKLPPNVVTNLPSYKSASALNIVLLDVLNTAVPRQSQAREALTRFLEELPPPQPIAVYLLGDKLRLVQDFTDDPQALKNAVARLQNASSKRLDNPTGGPPLVTANENLDATPAAMKERIKGMRAENEAFLTADRVRITLDALNSIARNAAGYPGRKNLIWISDAFPFNIGSELGLKAAARNDLQRYNQHSDKMLMDSQVAIYPIDAHALEVISLYDIGIGWPYNLGVRAINAGPAALAFASQDFNQHLGVHTAMNDLAANTGGEAFYYRNGVENAIRQSISDGSTYYTLGYYPQNKNWDGKFRKIEVKVDRHNVHLRHRLGYYAFEPDSFLKQNAQQRAREFHRALDLAAPASTGLLFQAAVVLPSEKSGNQVLVNFGIDPHGLSFEKDDKGLQHATLECAVEAYSDKGELMKSEGTEVSAALEPDAFARIIGSFFPCQQRFELPAGSYHLRVGVIDGRTGSIGTANASVTVPAGNSPASPSK